MDYPLITIITVNYDHPEVTCALLESLRKVSYPNVEILVVDNASPNDNPAIISEMYPEVVFIQNKENLGFAGGNNVAVRQAKGKYVLFLNNDTEVEAHFLEPMVAKLESDPTIGAVSPKIKYWSKPEILQFTGQAPINPWTVRSHGFGWGKLDDGTFDRDVPTYYVHGAAMMVPMSVIREVGLMAEIYFLYYEELDWGARIRATGKSLWYVHDSLVLHKESISVGKMNPSKTYWMNRSRWLYLRRNIHDGTFLVAAAFQVVVSIPKNLLMFLAKGQKEHLKAYLNALSWHCKHIRSKDIHFNPTL